MRSLRVPGAASAGVASQSARSATAAAAVRSPLHHPSNPLDPGLRRCARNGKRLIGSIWKVRRRPSAAAGCKDRSTGHFACESRTTSASGYERSGRWRSWCRTQQRRRPRGGRRSRRRRRGGVGRRQKVEGVAEGSARARWRPSEPACAGYRGDRKRSEARSRPLHTYSTSPPSPHAAHAITAHGIERAHTGG